MKKLRKKIKYVIEMLEYIAAMVYRMALEKQSKTVDPDPPEPPPTKPED